MALRSALPLLRCSRGVFNGQVAAFSRCNPALSDIQIKDKIGAGRALKASEVAGTKQLSEMIPLISGPTLQQAFYWSVKCQASES